MIASATERRRRRAPLRRHRPGRRGMSMTELMVSLTGSSLLLGLAAALIGLLLRAEASGRAGDLAAAETARLARQFRRDVHAARGVAPPPAQADAALLVQLQSAAGQRVAYRLAGARIERVEQRDGAVARRDSFTLLPGTQARVERSDAPAEMLRLVVWRDEQAAAPRDRGDDPIHHVAHIEAVLGRDGRFTQEVPDDR